MASVIITASAYNDITTILADLAAKAGISIAERYLNDFYVLFDRLKNFPAIGAPRHVLGDNTRISIVAPYIVIYDYVDADVTILRVLHGRRDITQRLLPR